MEEKKLKLQGVSFMDHPRVRAVAPLVMFLLVCVLFYFLTGGKIFAANNIKLLLSQTYMLMIASTGVFLVMTMGSPPLCPLAGAFLPRRCCPHPW